MIRGIEQQGDSVVIYVIYADTYQEAVGFFYGLVDDGKIVEDSEFSYGGIK